MAGCGQSGSRHGDPDSLGEESGARQTGGQAACVHAWTPAARLHGLRRMVLVVAVALDEQQSHVSRRVKVEHRLGMGSVLLVIPSDPSSCVLRSHEARASDSMHGSSSSSTSSVRRTASKQHQNRRRDTSRD